MPPSGQSASTLQRPIGDVVGRGVLLCNCQLPSVCESTAIYHTYIGSVWLRRALFSYLLCFNATNASCRKRPGEQFFTTQSIRTLISEETMWIYLDRQSLLSRVAFL